MARIWGNWNPLTFLTGLLNGTATQENIKILNMDFRYANICPKRRMGEVEQ